MYGEHIVVGDHKIVQGSSFADIGVYVLYSFVQKQGFQITDSIFLGYAYDYNTNGLGGYNSGSHEAIIKFYPGRLGEGPRDKQGRKLKKGKQIDSPRFF